MCVSVFFTGTINYKVVGVQGNSVQICNTRVQNNKYIHTLHMDTDFIGDICNCTIGPRAQTRENKTILLVGQTGSGKTTLINGMINYILGVNWESNLRFEIVPKETSLSQAHSQTSVVTVYQINYAQKTIPFSVTVIDTPGFGDTNWQKNDEKIKADIKKLFSCKDDIGNIDVVGLVVPSPTTRLTHAQSYIFESIKAVLGDDTGKRMVVLFTFCDRKDPPALKAIKSANLSCAKKQDGSYLYFLFNNCVLFGTASDHFSSNTRYSIEKMYWDMGTESMKSFFDTVQHMKHIQDFRESLWNDEMQIVLNTLVDLSLKLSAEKNSRQTKKLTDSYTDSRNQLLGLIQSMASLKGESSVYSCITKIISSLSDSPQRRELETLRVIALQAAKSH